MNLRKKVMLLAIVVCLLTSLVMFSIVRNQILEGFIRVETADVESNIRRATNELQEQVIDLDTLTCNYATSDDAYEFIKQNNTRYIQSKFVDETFEYNNLNMITYFDEYGKAVYSKGYEIPTITETALLKELTRFFNENDLLCKFSSVRDEKRGIINISDNLFTVASRPIVRTGGDGPVKGVVVMCQELTPQRVEELDRKLNLNLTLISYYSPNFSSDLQEVKTDLQKQAEYQVKIENSSFVTGYSLVTDVFGVSCGLLSVDISRSVYQQGSATTNTYTLVTLVWLIAFASVSLFVLEKAFLSRVTKLNGAVTEIALNEDLNQRITLDHKKHEDKSGDEISLLARSINHMLEKIQSVTNNLNKAQRFAAIGEFSVMIAHDLRNPLQGITIATKYLSREKTNIEDKKTRILNIIDSDVEYCEKIVSDLLDYSREIKIVPSRTNVHSILVSTLSHVQVPDNITINDLTQQHDNVELVVDAEKMVRVFDNLVKNALDVMADVGSLTVRTEIVENKMRIIFEDTGKGISKENIEKMFTPLFTTKAKGMGFGLAICKRIVEAHKGTITVESVLNKGTKFSVELPL